MFLLEGTLVLAARNEPVKSKQFHPTEAKLRKEDQQQAYRRATWAFRTERSDGCQPWQSIYSGAELVCCNKFSIKRLFCEACKAQHSNNSATLGVLSQMCSNAEQHVNFAQRIEPESHAAYHAHLEYYMMDVNMMHHVWRMICELMHDAWICVMHAALRGELLKRIYSIWIEIGLIWNRSGLICWSWWVHSGITVGSQLHSQTNRKHKGVFRLCLRLCIETEMYQTDARSPQGKRPQLNLAWLLTIPQTNHPTAIPKRAPWYPVTRNP